MKHIFVFLTVALSLTACGGKSTAPTRQSPNPKHQPEAKPAELKPVDRTPVTILRNGEPILTAIMSTENCGSWYYIPRRLVARRASFSDGMATVKIETKKELFYAANLSFQTSVDYTDSDLAEVQRQIKIQFAGSRCGDINAVALGPLMVVQNSLSLSPSSDKSDQLYADLMLEFPSRPDSYGSIPISYFLSMDGSVPEAPAQLNDLIEQSTKAPVRVGTLHFDASTSMFARGVDSVFDISIYVQDLTPISESQWNYSKGESAYTCIRERYPQQLELWKKYIGIKPIPIDRECLKKKDS